MIPKLYVVLLLLLSLLSTPTTALFGGGEQKKKEEAATDSLKEGLELLKDPKNVREAMMQLNDPATKREVDRMLADPTFRKQLERMKSDPAYRATIDGTKAALADPDNAAGREVNQDGDAVSDAQLGMSELAKAAKDPKLMAEAMNMMKDPGELINRGVPSEFHAISPDTPPPPSPPNPQPPFPQRLPRK